MTNRSNPALGNSEQQTIQSEQQSSQPNQNQNTNQDPVSSQATPTDPSDQRSKEKWESVNEPE